jgi:hypothetical protein
MSLVIELPMMSTFPVFFWLFLSLSCLGFNCSTVLFLDTGVEVDEIPLVNDFDGHIDVVIVF